MQIRGFEIQADEEDLSFSEVTAERVFCRQDTPIVLQAPVVKAEVKLDEDNDRESDDDDFKIRYRQPKDNY